jgi:hypothetical protein
MKYLSIILVAICSIATVNTTNAQGLGKYTSNSNAQLMQDRDGKPILAKDYTDVVGTPYLAPEWSTGIVKLINGQTYKDVALKYNLMEDEVYFKSEKGDEPLSFTDPVSEFTITYKDNETGETHTNYYRKGFNGINRTTPNSYFEVLSDGTVQLLKKKTVGVVVSQEWNSATKVKNFKDETKYYLVKNGQATQVKKDKKLLENFSDKKQQIENYASSNKINFKSDADLSKLVTYYNSL